jgi:hypothetical protein
MRLQTLLVIAVFSLFAFAKESPAPILISHNDITGPRVDQTHTEDLKIFPDGRVLYSEAGNDRKSATFHMQLSQQKLHKLTALIAGKDIRSLPAEIGSQIPTIGYDWEKKLELHAKGSPQTVVIKNFYPLLNSHRPAYPRALIELECMLQGIQRSAAKRPAPTGEDDWCPEALGSR